MCPLGLSSLALFLQLEDAAVVHNLQEEEVSIFEFEFWTDKIRLKTVKRPSTNEHKTIIMLLIL